MFRFTIRDVLWLMVVVGMGAALWIEHGKYVEVKEYAIERTLESDMYLRSWLRSEYDAHGTTDHLDGKYHRPMPDPPWVRH
jgi:hypothetical protein